jgi:hypothetical protein
MDFLYHLMVHEKILQIHNLAVQGQCSSWTSFTAFPSINLLCTSVARACNQISNVLQISFHRLTQDQSDHYNMPTCENFDLPLLQNNKCSEQIFSIFFGEGNIK